MQIRRGHYIDLFYQSFIYTRYLNRVCAPVGKEALNRTRLSDTIFKKYSKYKISNFKFDFEDHIIVIPSLNKVNKRVFTWISALLYISDKPYLKSILNDKKELFESFGIIQLITDNKDILKVIYGQAKLCKLIKAFEKFTKNQPNSLKLFS